MALGRKRLEPEPEPEQPADTIKHQLMLGLRILSALCGVAIAAIGAFVSVQAGPNHKTWSFERYTAALLVGFFQVLFGLLILAAEWRMTCVARLFGFMALRMGKASILLFNGGLMCSLSKDWADGNLAPVVVGITCLVVGAVQFVCAVPCGPCTLPSDPLRAKLGTGQPPAKDKGGKGRKKAQEDDAAPAGGVRGKLFRGASSNDVEVSIAEDHASPTLGTRDPNLALLSLSLGLTPSRLSSPSPAECCATGGRPGVRQTHLGKRSNRRSERLQQSRCCRRRRKRREPQSFCSSERRRLRSAQCPAGRASIRQGVRGIHQGG